jgi:TolB-like protein
MRMGMALGLLLFATAAAGPQGQPPLAVLPLQPLGGLSPEQAETVTRLLETGLVKSAAFQVLERGEIAQVLAAQEWSLEGFCDEDEAVRLGRLLSARLIVLGTLSLLGERLFLTAKIIEVATGRTLKAGHEEADTLEAIARQAESLGHRLAGLPPNGLHGLALASPSEAPPPPEPPVPRKQRLLEEKQKLESVLARETRRARNLRRGSRVLYGIAAGLAAAAGGTLAGGLLQPADDASRAWFGFSLSFAVLAGAGVAVGTSLWLEQPDLAELHLQVELLEKRIMEEEER